MDIIKKAFEIVQKKGNLYNEKYDSNWISYIDKEGCIHTFDYFADDSLCEDCVDKKIDEINKKITEKDSDIKIPYNFHKLCYQTESDREGTNFHLCDECGEIIHQSIIWTDQEIDHWLNIMNDNDYKKIKHISTYFELMNIFDPDYGTSEEFPEETKKIAVKVIKFIK